MPAELTNLQETKKKIGHLMKLRAMIMETYHSLDTSDIQKIDKVINYYQYIDMEKKSFVDPKDLPSTCLNIFKYNLKRMYFAPLHEFLRIVPNNIGDFIGYKFVYCNNNVEAYKNPLHMVIKFDEFQNRSEYYICEDHYYYTFNRDNNLVRAITNGRFQMWKYT